MIVRVFAPWFVHVSATPDAESVTSSLNVTSGVVEIATPVAPFAGFVDATNGAASPDVPVIEMSSTPIISSVLGASVIRIRTSTSGWLSAAAGSCALTGVTSVAVPPWLASATNPAGTLV